MAKKMNALQVVEASRAEVEIQRFRHAPFSPALYMMQLQLPKRENFPPKRKLPIFVDAETRAQIEHPVEIRHIA
jgi:hypothetical protein